MKVYVHVLGTTLRNQSQTLSSVINLFFFLINCMHIEIYDYGQIKWSNHVTVQSLTC